MNQPAVRLQARAGPFLGHAIQDVLKSLKSVVHQPPTLTHHQTSAEQGSNKSRTTTERTPNKCRTKIPIPQGQRDPKGSRNNKFTFWRERRAGRCKAPRRRRCVTSSRSGNAADARPPPRPAGRQARRYPTSYTALSAKSPAGNSAAECEVIIARALSRRLRDGVLFMTSFSSRQNHGSAYRVFGLKSTRSTVTSSPFVARNPGSRRLAASRRVSPAATSIFRLSYTSKHLACFAVIAQCWPCSLRTTARFPSTFTTSTISFFAIPLIAR